LYPFDMEAEKFLLSTEDFCADASVTEGEALSASALARGWKVYRLDARRMTDKKALLDHLAAELAFPAYFGGNWDAVMDCLTDFDGKSLVLVADCALLEKSDPALLADFRDVMDSAGRSLHEFRKGAAGLKTIFLR